MKIQYTYECPDCHTAHRIGIDTDEMLKLPVKSLSDSELRRAIGFERSRIRSNHPDADAARLSELMTEYAERGGKTRKRVAEIKAFEALKAGTLTECTPEEIADAIHRIKRKISNAGKVNLTEDTAELEKVIKLLELEQAKRRVAAMMAEIGIEG
jgi:hypothetical protein